MQPLKREDPKGIGTCLKNRWEEAASKDANQLLRKNIDNAMMIKQIEYKDTIINYYNGKGVNMGR